MKYNYTEEFIVEKMREGTFDDEEELFEYLNHDYQVLGGEEAFLIYFPLREGVVWVHYLWSINKRKMRKVMKQLLLLHPIGEDIILFDCDICEGYNALHKRSATRVYMWNKELT